MDQLSRKQTYCSSIEDQIEIRERKEESLGQLKAAAAAAAGTSRELAGSVRLKLERQDSCPYCGGELGEAPHADHIYPVSKGGRSTKRNMVLVCSACNALKRDMTLSAFIRANDLDRNEIERRLGDLGKDF